MSFRRIAGFIAASAFLFLHSQAADAPPTLPASPSDLLNVLPAASSNWTLLRSDAQTTLGSWPQTRANRTYQSAPAQGGAQSGGRIELTILDTGSFAQSLGAFADFQPGKSGSVERLNILGYPALQTRDLDGNPLTQILLAGRYIATVKLIDLPGERIETWLRALRFDALPHSTPSASTTLPRQIRLTSIDELHPERNRSYLVSPALAVTPSGNPSGH